MEARDSARNEPDGLRDGPVYLDYNATTPIDPRVAAAALPYLMRHFGNPSSSHVYGSAPHEAIVRARAAVAGLLAAGDASSVGYGGGAGEVVFTGSGSEANLLGLRGCVLAPSSPRTHVVTQASEHPAVLATCAALMRHHGTRITVLPVDGEGLLDPGLLERTLADAAHPQTAGERTLVSVMSANNETGALQPIAELSTVAHRYGALMHTDAAQAAGKIPLDVETLGADLVTVVGHKMYAPKGVAALWVRDGVDLEPVVYGGGQEGGRRSGTESVALIAGLGEAAELAARELAQGGVQRISALRDQLHDELERALPGRILLNGPYAARLPNTLNVSIAGVLTRELLARMSGVAASAGSACHSGVDIASPVLSAMGLSRERALGAIRLSLGRWSTEEDVVAAAAEVARVVRAG